MASSSNVTILIRGQDQASSALSRVKRSMEGVSTSAQNQGTMMDRLRDHWSTFAGISVGAGLALRGLFGQIEKSLDAANRYQAAQMGLNSVANAFGADADKAKVAAQKLASDGLMTVTDSATGLKNLLATGFSLDQAIQLMNRFKNSAAFGRQSSLSFGQAITSATEGVKNGNCLVGETPVLLSTGEQVPISELYERKDAITVYSLYPDGAIRHTSVSHVVSNGVKPVYQLTLDDGKTIRATGNHRFLTVEGYKLLQDLTTTDEILTIDEVSDYNDVRTWFDSSTTPPKLASAATKATRQQVQPSAGANSASRKGASSARFRSLSASEPAMTSPASVAVAVEAGIPLNRLEAQHLTGKAGEARPTLRVNNAARPLSRSQSLRGAVSAAGAVLNAESAAGAFYAAGIAHDGSPRFALYATGVTRQWTFGLPSPTRLDSVRDIAAIVGKALSAWLDRTTSTGRAVSRTVSRFARRRSTDAGDRRSSSGTMASVSAAAADPTAPSSTFTTSSSSAKTQHSRLTSATAKSSAGHATSVYTLRKSRVASVVLDTWEETYDLSVPETRNFIAAGMVVHNSILVDNAGVTKNLSMMLTDAGYSAQDLMKASTDAGVRQAIFNGILKETNPQLGDAAKLADSAAGKQAQMAAKTEVLQQKIGIALQPVLETFLKTIVPIITKISDWIEKHEGLTRAIIIGGGVLLGLIGTLGVVASTIKAATAVAAVFGPVFKGGMGIASRAASAFRTGSLSSLGGSLAKFAGWGIFAGLAVQAFSYIVNEGKRVIKLLDDIAAKSDDAVDAQARAHEAFKKGEIDAKQYQKALDEAAVKANNASKQAHSATEYYSGAGGLWHFITGGSPPARAAGGPVASGQTYMVGEHGPEMFRPNSSGTITTNDNSAAGDTIINITGTINIATPEAADSFWNRIDKTQRLAKVGMA